MGESGYGDRSPRQATINASGIARMAGVGRAAVSNWRRRYADFPSPVAGTPTSPVFDAVAVQQWLQHQGKLLSASKEDLVWRQIESFAPASRIGDALGVVGAYLLVESWQNETKGKASASSQQRHRLPSPKQLLSKLRARHPNLAEVAGAVFPGDWSPDFESLLRAAAELRHEQDPAVAFEYLHTKYVASPRSLSGPDATPDAVAEIMLTFAGEEGTVFDFTSGTGTLLYAAAQRALKKGCRVTCQAQEVKPQYAFITLLRLWFLHEQAAEAGLGERPPTVRIGDSLLSDRFPELRADVVLANPPFGIHDWGHDRLSYDARWLFGLPPRTEPELAWVQHALAHVKPGGTAVLLMPPAAAARPAGRRIRGELVRQGALRAVVALPAGMLPPVSIGLHLWVLQRPELSAVSGGPRLLFVDASATESHRPAARTVAPAAVRHIIERAWRAHLARAKTSPEELGRYRIVSAMEVLDDEIDLSPRRYLPLPTRPQRDPLQTVAAVSVFEAMMTEVHSQLPGVQPAGHTPLAEAPAVAIADLTRAGSLSIHRSVARSRGEEVPDRSSRPDQQRANNQRERPTRGPVLTTLDVLAGGPPTGTARPAHERELTVSVEAGDILIPVAGREVVARVAAPDQIGAPLGSGLYLVRVRPDLLDPWFVAGVLCRSDNTRLASHASTTSAGMLRFDIKRLTVPVLPLDRQREYGEAFRRLTEFRLALHRMVEQGNELARDITDGLAAGTLTIASS